LKNSRPTLRDRASTGAEYATEQEEGGASARLSTGMKRPAGSCQQIRHPFWDAPRTEHPRFRPGPGLDQGVYCAYVARGWSTGGRNGGMRPRNGHRAFDRRGGPTAWRAGRARQTTPAPQTTDPRARAAALRGIKFPISNCCEPNDCASVFEECGNARGHCSVDDPLPPVRRSSRF